MSNNVANVPMERLFSGELVTVEGTLEQTVGVLADDSYDELYESGEKPRFINASTKSLENTIDTIRNGFIGKVAVTDIVRIDGSKYIIDTFMDQKESPRQYCGFLFAIFIRAGDISALAHLIAVNHPQTGFRVIPVTPYDKSGVTISSDLAPESYDPSHTTTRMKIGECAIPAIKNYVNSHKGDTSHGTTRTSRTTSSLEHKGLDFRAR